MTVDNVAALKSALKSAQSGDTIVLAPGTYSGVEFEGVSFPGGVTITSADPGQKAVLTNFNISNAQGLTFTNLELLAQKPANFAFIIRGSSNITFDHVSVHGSLDGDSGNDANGLQFLNNKNVAVTNSEFQQLARGAAFGMSSNVNVASNYVHDIRSDGFDFAEVSNVRVTDNVLKSFSPAPKDHPDAIQFWTAGTKTASQDILISGNLIMRGEGTGSMQGIFMGDELGALPFTRVTVANNLIVGTGYNAVRIHGAKDLTLTNNELVSNPGQENRTFMLIQKADGVTATGNKAISIGFDRVTNLTQDDNKTTKPVDDHGQGALKAWGANHPVAAPHAAPEAPVAPSADVSPLTVLPTSDWLDELPTPGAGGSDWSTLLV